MTKKQKIILYSMISIVIVIFLITNYRVFWSPFQILSKSDMEKNREGICLAEGRKLTDQELFTRAMDDYWTKWKAEQLLDQADKLYPRCEHYSDCYFYKIPEPLTMTEYTKKIQDRPKGTDFATVMKDYLQTEKIFESQKLENINQFNYIKLPFSFITSDGNNFFPTDCCSILSEQRYRDDFIAQDPVKNTELSGQGIGNYFLSFKYLWLKGSSSRVRDKPYYLLPNWLFMDTLVIDNCGKVTNMHLIRDNQIFGIKDENWNGLYFNVSVEDKYDILEQGSSLNSDSLYWTGEKFVKSIDFKQTEEYQRLREQAKQNAEREKEQSSN